MSIFKSVKQLYHGGKLQDIYWKYCKGYIYKSRNVTIKNSVISKYTCFAHDSSIENSTIGARTSIGRYTIIRHSDVGKYCSISWRVTIGADHHPTERISGSGAFFLRMFGLVDHNCSKGTVKRCSIGNDVLIGCHTVIISGVKVGDGAIIGSGSVVTHDVEPYQIVAGNPARPIRMRFDDETISMLKEYKWWDFDDDYIKKNIDLFQKPIDKITLSRLIENNKTNND